MTRILAIETSCDETALAVLECSGAVSASAITPLSQALYSQTKDHAPFGGVFPALAKREHIKNLVPLFLKAMDDAGMNYDTVSQPPDETTLRSILSHEAQLADDVLAHLIPLGIPRIDAIAVTRGPGLEPALWVGLNFAKALSYAWNIPLIPTNHMEGHIVSVLVKKADDDAPSQVEYPAIALLVSGGHTELVRVDAPLSYERIGETRDDAVGEAYDKVARLLDLPYPGGPEISKLAHVYRTTKKDTQQDTGIAFPRPMIRSDDYDFSFAGLKTAVLYKVRALGDITDELREIIAYEFEEAAVDTLVAKTKKALENIGAKTLIVGGGVIANAYLRERLEELSAEFDVTLLLPTRDLSTDNAVMIGAAAYLHIAQGEIFKSYVAEQELDARGTLRL